MILVLLSCITIGGWAQSNNSPEELKALKKEMLQIKRQGEMLYADVMHEVAGASVTTIVDLTKNDAVERLHADAIEALVSVKDMNKKVRAELLEYLKQNSKHIIICNDEMVRVFAYIAKDSIGIKQQRSQVIGGTLLPDTLASTVDTLTNDSVKIDTLTTIPALKLDSALVDSIPDTLNTISDTLKIEIPQLVNEMLKQNNKTVLLHFLEEGKAYERLIFGGERSMRYPHKCYIVILDRNTRKIVGVLDKGISDRMNFVTKKTDNLNNYRGNKAYEAVFVQEL